MKLSHLRKHFTLAKDLGFLRAGPVLWGTCNFFIASVFWRPARAALVTCSIYPDLGELWWYFARRLIEAHQFLIAVIADSSGSPGWQHHRYPARCRIVRLWNVEHGRKMDWLCRSLPVEWVWFCDDDVLLLDKGLPAAVEEAFRRPTTWALSLLPRAQQISCGGRSERAVGSYCVAVRRQVILKEDLSFRVKATSEPTVNWGRGYYDTADYAHRSALEKGYRTAYLESQEGLAGFMGTTIMYLKMRRKNYGMADFEKDLALLPHDWRRISGHLGSAWCLHKIQSLYREAWQREPRWHVPVSEGDLIDLARRLASTEAQRRAFEYFARYEEEYLKARAVIRRERSEARQADEDLLRVQ